ncbi:MAG: type VI secretion system contractile sheath large subunit [Pseudomonadota bacterium]
MADEDTQEAGAEGQETDQSLLEQIIYDGKIARDRTNADQRANARKMVQEFVDKVLADENIMDDQVQERIKEQITALDEKINAQLNEIMHHKSFQELEATWRGLHYLVMNAETGQRLKIRVLNVSKKDLLKDLQKAVEFDQSALFKKVYEEEYGTFGGNPFSMLIGDYSFGRHPTNDFALLKLIAEVAAAAHAPFISAADPALLDMDSWTELPAPRDLAKIFDSAEMATWRSFRESEDSRYITLTLPRVLLRLPYGVDTVEVEGLNFEEEVYVPGDPDSASEIEFTDNELLNMEEDARLALEARRSEDGKLYKTLGEVLRERLAGGESRKDIARQTVHNRYLWGNPAYIMGERIANAFSLHGWTAAIRGVEGGGKVEGLPNHTFRTVEGDVIATCPTEVQITDRRENELNHLGFVTVVHKKNEDYAAFFGGQTVNKPKTYNKAAANANARLSAMLPYMLNASRFAHYVKVIVRDKVGSFMTEDNLRDYLNVWISDYVLGKDDAGQSIKAKYPLREARVDVTPIPGRPGSYNAVIFLRPHFQLEDLTASIRLVAELPPAA